MNSVTSNPPSAPSSPNRGVQILGNIAHGATGGLVGFGIIRLLSYFRLVSVGKEGIEPISFILTGVISAAVLESARLTHDVALYLLGDRKTFEHLTTPEKASSSALLRQKSWKVVAKFEKIGEKVDQIYSGFFNIRTASEIRKKYKTDIMYFQDKPRTMEIARRAFCEQLNQTIKRVVPQGIGIYGATYLGYNVFGAKAFFWVNVIFFISGIQTKMMEYDLEQRAAEEKQEEVKKTCDLLASLYPEEFNLLEKGEEIDEKISMSHAKFSHNRIEYGPKLFVENFSTMGSEEGDDEMKIKEDSLPQTISIATVSMSSFVFSMNLSVNS